MNRKELERSVKQVYGDIDAHIYLQKFIHIEATIPKNKNRNHQHGKDDIQKYSEQLFKAHQLDTLEMSGGEWLPLRLRKGDNLIDYLTTLAKHFELSLRQLERAYTNVVVFYGQSGKKTVYRDTPLVAFLAIIKVVEPSLYEALLHNEMTYQSLFEKTGLVTEEHENLYLRRLLEYLLMSEDEFSQRERNCDDPVMKMQGRQQNILYTTIHICRQDLIPYFIGKMNMLNVVL